MEFLRATLSGYIEQLYAYRDIITDYIPFSVPTAERKAAVETSLLRRLSQRPRKEELENRGILKSEWFVCCDSEINLIVCLGNNKSWKQELEEKQTNLNRQVRTRVINFKFVLFNLF